jgi:hypothetical protein
MLKILSQYCNARHVCSMGNGLSIPILHYIFLKRMLDASSVGLDDFMALQMSAL